eukprot:1180463-Prorocentrum_minimum.AAC.2
MVEVLRRLESPIGVKPVATTSFSLKATGNAATGMGWGWGRRPSRTPVYDHLRRRTGLYRSTPPSETILISARAAC